MTLQTLEDALRQVERYRRDLTTEIVAQEEEGHWEETVCFWKGGCGEEGRNTWEYDDQEWVIDKPRIVHPDIQKQEEARRQLHQFYEGSPWYSARYSAGVALKKDVKKQLNDWANNLRGDLNSEKEIEGHYEDEEVCVGGWHSSGGTLRYDTRKIWVEATTMPDEEKRLRIVEDLKKLFKLANSGKINNILLDAYYNNNLKNVRWEAGRALGYSELGMWAHEHPIATTASTIVAAGVTSGLGYMLYQYMTR